MYCVVQYIFKLYLDITILFTTNTFLIVIVTVLKQSFTTTRVEEDYEGKHLVVNWSTSSAMTFLGSSCIPPSIINTDFFRPVNVPLDIFSEEIQFYELGESAINKFRLLSLKII